jgi:Flp pilus assembly protein protease CpaA
MQSRTYNITYVILLLCPVLAMFLGLEDPSAFLIPHVYIGGLLLNFMPDQLFAQKQKKSIQ